MWWREVRHEMSEMVLCWEIRGWLRRDQGGTHPEDHSIFPYTGMLLVKLESICEDELDVIGELLRGMVFFTLQAFLRLIKKGADCG